MSIPLFTKIGNSEAEAWIELQRRADENNRFKNVGAYAAGYQTNHRILNNGSSYCLTRECIIEYRDSMQPRMNYTCKFGLGPRCAKCLMRDALCEYRWEYELALCDWRDSHPELFLSEERDVWEKKLQLARLSAWECYKRPYFPEFQQDYHEWRLKDNYH